MSQVIWFILFGCQEKAINVPGGTNNQNPQDTTTPSNDVDCGDQWEQDENGIWFDPVACAAWSPLSSAKTWHQVVSSSEAENGGCDEFCDVEPDLNYCADLDLGGFSWKTPTIDQLKDIVTRQPPFESLDHDLWSRDSDPIDEMAWTANADQPGMEVSLYKTSEAYVRCIAE